MGKVILFSYWYTFWINWNVFWSVFHVLDRKTRLEGLIMWSKRKQLLGPHRFYQRYLMDIELNLSRKSHRHPSLTKWAYFLYELKTLIGPTQKYYARGSAVIYKLK